MEKDEEGQLRLAAKRQSISRANGAEREGPHSLKEQRAVNRRCARLKAGGMRDVIQTRVY